MAACASIKGDNGAGAGTGGTTSVLNPDAGERIDAPAVIDLAPGTIDVNTDVPGACRGLACQQTTCDAGPCRAMACPSGQRTTVTGTVYDPAGDLPLYGVAVYVPNAPLAPLPDGVACNRCQATITNALSAAISDVNGHFRLDDVPVGKNIPIVVQVGKWRRATTIPEVAACTETALADPDLTRLPASQAEGDLPRIALTTGMHDALECLLRKVGVADSEFTTETGKGRVNLYAGVGGTDRFAPTLNGGAMFTPVVPWWDNLDNLKKYDVIIYSCEGVPMATNKSAAALKAFSDYANAGGRIFASHFHNYWIANNQPPLSTVATFDNQLPALNEVVASIDTSAPKGAAMADWLNAMGATPTRGQLTIDGTRNTVTAMDMGLAQRWIYLDTPRAIQYLTTNTPVGAAAEDQCGRIVFSDIHVSAGKPGFPIDRSLNGPGDPDYGFPFPTGCMTTSLSPQELALAFMLFDLQSCILGGIPVVQ